MKFQVIAEGVDSQAQLDALNELECIYGQGKVLKHAKELDMTSLAS